MKRKVLLCMFMLAASTRYLSGAVLFNNGSPDGLGGSQMSEFFQADDFILASASDLTGIRFWDLEASVADYAGSIFWYIFTDSAGLPGSQLFSGTATPARTAAGSAFGYNIFQNDFSIAVNLAAGTYWLVLHNGDPVTNNSFTDYYWATSDQTGNSTSRGAEQPINPPDAWGSNGLEHAFQVSGTLAADVPEPGAFLLMSGGLMVLWGARRRLI